MTFLFSLRHCEQFLKHLNNLCVLSRQFLDCRVSVCATINRLTAIRTSAAFLPQTVRMLDMGWQQRILLPHNKQIWFLPPSWEQAFKRHFFFSSGYQTQALHGLGKYSVFGLYLQPLFLFWDKILLLYIYGWPWTCFVAWVGLDVNILLALPPKC